MIKSSQIFETHTESLEEIQECWLENLENGFILHLENGILKWQDKTFTMDRDGFQLMIQPNERWKTQYPTSYGMIAVEIVGIEVEVTMEPVLMIYLKYQMKLGDSESYINEVRIQVE